MLSWPEAWQDAQLHANTCMTATAAEALPERDIAEVGRMAALWGRLRIRCTTAVLTLSRASHARWAARLDSVVRCRLSRLPARDVAACLHGQGQFTAAFSVECGRLRLQAVQAAGLQCCSMPALDKVRLLAVHSVTN